MKESERKLGGSENNTVIYTRSGCACKETWTATGFPECTTYCCNPDDDARGDWCFVEDPVCEGESYGYCGEYETIEFDAAPSNNSVNNYTSTIQGCDCKRKWDIDNSECTDFCCDPDESGFDWCMVKASCTTGSNWGKCGPVEPGNECCSI